MLGYRIQAPQNTGSQIIAFFFNILKLALKPWCLLQNIKENHCIVRNTECYMISLLSFKSIAAKTLCIKDYNLITLYSQAFYFSLVLMFLIICRFSVQFIK